MIHRSSAWSGGTVAGVAAATGLIIGLRSIARVELPRLEPLIGLEAIPREGLGISWSARAVWPADVQSGGLERLVVVLAALVLAAALVATLNAVILLAESASHRRRELAVRVAVGATPAVLAAGLLRELRGVLLVGGALGTVLGITAGGLARLVWPGPVTPGWPTTSGDVLVGLAVALACVSAASVITGLRASGGPGAAAALRAGARTGSDPMAVFVRKALTAGHTAVAGTLLVGAVTLIPTSDGTDAPETRDSETIVYGVTSPGPGGWGPILEALGEIPGIEAESLASPGALVGLGIREIATSECGRCWRGDMPAPLWTAVADHHAVAPGFFDLAGLPIVDGRDFTTADGPGAERVALVNETFARTSFERGAPIGKKIRIGSDFANWYTVIGVVADERVAVVGGDESAREAIYMSALQQPPRSATLLVTGTDAATEEVGAALMHAGYSPTLRATLPEHRAAAAAELRWTQRIAALLAVLALALAAHGVYAAALQTTRRRIGELAVRRALGAEGRTIASHVLVGRLRVVLWGLAGFGFFGTAMVALLQNASGLPAASPLDYAAIAVLLVVVALLASARAARESLAVDPAVLLE